MYSSPVQALRLCTGRTAFRGSRGIALLFLDHGTRRGRGVSVTPRTLFTPGKTQYPLYRRLGGPQDRSGQVRKISPSTGIRSPDRPARSQSLYRLRYPAHFYDHYTINIYIIKRCPSNSLSSPFPFSAPLTGVIHQKEVGS